MGEDFLVLLKQRYRLEEADVANGHDQFDGIEVFLAIEAARQIGVGMGGRMETGTEGALKPHHGVDLLGGYLEELCHQAVNVDVISQCIKCL